MATMNFTTKPITLVFVVESDGLDMIHIPKSIRSLQLFAIDHKLRSCAVSDFSVQHSIT